MSNNPPIGLIAGNGSLPLLFAQKVAVEESRPLVVAAHLGETDHRIQELVDDVLWAALGQFKKIIRFFKDRRVHDVVLAGGISKTAIWRIRPDAMALKLAWRLSHLHDDHLLREIAAELAGHGFRVQSVTDYLPQLLAPLGVLSNRHPDGDTWEDIRIGWKAAKVLGGLDIGQGVIVKRKVIVAVEAMEGTDAMMQRAGQLVRGSSHRSWAGRGDVVLVKTSKPEQDLRLDLPTVGPKTVEGMKQAGIGVLAIEAGKTLVLEPEVTIKMINLSNLVFVACEDRELLG